MSNYSRLLEILEKLVCFRTTEGNRKEMIACLDFCEQILQPHGLHINRYSSNGIPSLVATSHPTKKPTLLLAAHLDVLPAADDMFKITGEGTKLVGRGAIDMKFAAACFLYLVEEIGDRCAEFDFGIMFTMDEEQDSLNGVEYLLDQGYGCDLCFLPDGGNNWKVESSAKGAWRANLEVSGRSAHASRPWLGDNPIMRMMQLMTAAAKLTSDDPLKGTTVVPTIFKAGTGSNQIPDDADGVLDIRFPTREEYERVHAALDKLGKKYKIEVVTTLFTDALTHDTKVPAFGIWRDIVKEVRGPHATGYMQSVAQSDAWRFVSRGIPTLVTRPTGGDLHGPEEWVDEAGVYDYFDCLKVFLEKVSLKPAETP